MGIDAALWSIVSLGLRKDPAERVASMSELGQQLADWLAARGVCEDITGASLRAQWPTVGLVQPEPPSA